LILLRLLAALLAAFALVVAVEVSVAGEFRTKLPRLALAWTPLDADARTALAANLVGMSSDPKAHAAARALASDAIRRSPLSPVALRAFGLSMASGDKPDPEAAANVMREAERLSRRDQPTQIWLIQHHLLRQDMAAAMRQMDVALRSASSGSVTLFGWLALASEDERIAREVGARLRAKPDWARSFFTYMVANGKNPQRTAYFARQFLDPSDPDHRELLTTFVAKLGELHEYELAWDVTEHFAGTGPDAVTAGGLVGGDFESAGGYAPFAWSLAQEGDLWAERQAGPEGSHGHVLAVSAHSGRTGEAARQLVRLAPGTYRLSATVGNLPTDPFERPEIRVRCAEDENATPLIGLRPRQAGVQARSLEGRFTVPSGCRFQWLTIAVAGDGPEPELIPWVDEIRLGRAGAAR
jgi:hypothetical protein